MILSSPALAATLQKTSRSEDNSKSSPLELISGSLSMTTTYASNPNDASNINLPSLSNASQLLSNYSSLYDQSFGTELNENPGEATCNGTTYGVQLNAESCLDAWQNVGLFREVASWGPRGPGHAFEYKLPARFSSGEIATSVERG